MAKTVILDHPLIKHKVAIMRNKNTGTREFKAVAKEIAMLMCYEATRELAVEDVDIETPITTAHCQMLAGKKLAIVPILRAGLGMVDGILELIPSAKIGHIGLYRNEETLEPVEYYCKMPTDIEKRQVLVLDPMLATGGSAIAAIDFIKQRGAKRIKLMCIIGAPEGVEAVMKAHPDIELFIGTVDEKLNEKGYIVPGLGDAGDRLFGTI